MCDCENDLLASGVTHLVTLARSHTARLAQLRDERVRVTSADADWPHSPGFRS